MPIRKFIFVTLLALALIIPFAQAVTYNDYLQAYVINPLSKDDRIKDYLYNVFTVGIYYYDPINKTRQWKTVAVLPNGYNGTFALDFGLKLNISKIKILFAIRNDKQDTLAVNAFFNITFRINDNITEYTFHTYIHDKLSSEYTGIAVNKAIRMLIYGKGLVVIELLKQFTNSTKIERITFTQLVINVDAIIYGGSESNPLLALFNNPLYVLKLSELPLNLCTPLTSSSESSEASGGIGGGRYHIITSLTPSASIYIDNTGIHIEGPVGSYGIILTPPIILGLGGYMKIHVLTHNVKIYALSVGNLEIEFSQLNNYYIIYGPAFIYGLKIELTSNINAYVADKIEFESGPLEVDIGKYMILFPLAHNETSKQRFFNDFRFTLYGSQLYFDLRFKGKDTTTNVFLASGVLALLALSPVLGPASIAIAAGLLAGYMAAGWVKHDTQYHSIPDSYTALKQLAEQGQYYRIRTGWQAKLFEANRIAKTYENVQLTLELVKQASIFLTEISDALGYDSYGRYAILKPGSIFFRLSKYDIEYFDEFLYDPANRGSIQTVLHGFRFKPTKVNVSTLKTLIDEGKAILVSEKHLGNETLPDGTTVVHKKKSYDIPVQEVNINFTFRIQAYVDEYYDSNGIKISEIILNATLTTLIVNSTVGNYVFTRDICVALNYETPATDNLVNYFDETYTSSYILEIYSNNLLDSSKRPVVNMASLKFPNLTLEPAFRIRTSRPKIYFTDTSADVPPEARYYKILNYVLEIEKLTAYFNVSFSIPVLYGFTKYTFNYIGSGAPSVNETSIDILYWPLVPPWANFSLIRVNDNNNIAIKADLRVYGYKLELPNNASVVAKDLEARLSYLADLVNQTPSALIKANLITYQSARKTQIIINGSRVNNVTDTLSGTKSDVEALADVFIDLNNILAQDPQLYHVDSISTKLGYIETTYDVAIGVQGVLYRYSKLIAVQSSTLYSLWNTLKSIAGYPKQIITLAGTAYKYIQLAITFYIAYITLGAYFALFAAVRAILRGENPLDPLVSYAERVLRPIEKAASMAGSLARRILL